MLLRSVLLLLRLLLLLLLLLFLQREFVRMLRAGQACDGYNGVDERRHAVVLHMRLLRLCLHLALLLLVLRLQQVLLTLLLQALVVETSSLLQLQIDQQRLLVFAMLRNRLRLLRLQLQMSRCRCPHGRRTETAGQ